MIPDCALLCAKQCFPGNKLTALFIPLQQVISTRETRKTQHKYLVGRAKQKRVHSKEEPVGKVKNHKESFKAHRRCFLHILCSICLDVAFEKPSLDLLGHSCSLEVCVLLPEEVQGLVRKVTLTTLPQCFSEPEISSKSVVSIKASLCRVNYAVIFQTHERRNDNAQHDML